MKKKTELVKHPKKIRIKEDRYPVSTTLLKKEVPEHVAAQLAMHSTKHAQKIHGIRRTKLDGIKKTDSLVEHVKGRDIRALCKNRKNRKWLQKNSDVIIDQLTQFIVDSMKQGMIHHDLHGGNVVISKKKDKLRLKVIDFEGAELTSEAVRTPHIADPEFLREVAKNEHLFHDDPKKFVETLSKHNMSKFSTSTFGYKLQAEVHQPATEIAKDIYGTKEGRERFKKRFFKMFEKKISEQM